MQALGAGEVEKGLVDGERLDQRRQVEHHGADLAADRGVFLHVGRDDDRVRTGLQRPEHRHRRAHAADAGDIAGGGDHAALSAADDDRLVLERRIVALFDRRIEGVAVEMGDRQAVQLGVADEARTAARHATRGA